MSRVHIASVVLACAGLGATVPAGAQSIGQITKGIQQATKAWQDTKFTDAEEQQLGADVSAKLREKYGVVQDAAVHRYVTLAGSVLAERSSRPDLRWTFIVLDTDGVLDAQRDLERVDRAQLA